MVVRFSDEELYFFNDLGGKAVPNSIVVAPEMLGFPVPVKELGWFTGDNLQFEVVPPAVPRIEHLAIWPGACCRNGHCPTRLNPDDLPRLPGQLCSLPGNRR